MRSTFPTIYRAFSGYRLHLALLVVLGFLSGILEGIGISAVIPLFSFLVGGGPGDDVLSRAVEGLFSYLPFALSTGSLLVFILALFVARAAILVLFNYFRARVSTSYLIRMMNELLERTLHAQWGYLLTQRLGYAEVTLTRDVRQGSALLEALSQGVLVVTSLLIYGALAITISLPVTLAAALVGLLILLLLQPVRRGVQRVATRAALTEKAIAYFVNEHVLGMKTVKSAGTERAVFEKGVRLFEDFKHILVRSTLVQSLGTASVQPLSLAFICGVFVYFQQTGPLSLGALIALIYLIQKIFTYIEAGQSALHSISEKVPYVENTLAFRELLMRHEEHRSGQKPFEFSRDIVFRGVSFSYDPASDTPTVSNLGFRLGRGEMIGLVGPSGSGKTTVADLLLRLFVPQEGSIKVDDVPVEELSLAQWRGKVGYVSQDMFLLNDTIRNNILFYDTDISQDEVLAAAQTANCMEFIDALPQGLDTPVGERGLLLSAGQRQRIILARVLARRPDLLILDEATSALDNESERLIQEAIERLRGGVTIVVIAHRLTTVLRADRLLVLERGRLVEEGAPQELLADEHSRFYRAFHGSQEL